jgi:hypothetical protein
MMPAYSIFRLLYDVPPLARMDQRFKDEVVSWAVRVFSVSLLFAWSVLLLAQLIARFTQSGTALFGSALYFLTTTTICQSTAGTGEIFALPFILLSFLSLIPGDRLPDSPFRAGIAIGIATLMVYQVGLIAVGVALYYLLFRRGAALLRFLAPFVLCVFFLLLYNRLIFDGWLHFPVLYWVGLGTASAETVLVEWPTGFKLYEMLASPFRGILFYFPFVFFFVYGVRTCFEKKDATLAMAAAFLIVFLFYCFNTGWYAGCDFGWRYVLIVLPILFVFAWVGMEKRGLFVLASVLLIWSGLVVLIGLFGRPQEVRGSIYTDPIFGAWLRALLMTGPPNALTDVLEHVRQQKLDPASRWALSLPAWLLAWTTCLWVGFKSGIFNRTPDKKTDK